jgi:broad specificity phosphatase PhoE
LEDSQDMAKRVVTTGSNGLNATAETLGTALGRLQARVASLKQERAAIASDLQRLLQSAQTLLADLGHAGVVAVAPSRRTGGRPKGYKMSEQTKAKLRAAWKRRKAATARSKAS